MSGPSIASKRLFHEYRTLASNPPDGITAGPVSEDDIFTWEALIQGPEGTPYEGGIFPAELKFPKDYPHSPPSMKFVPGVWHPNGKHSVLSFFPIHLTRYTHISTHFGLRVDILFCLQRLWMLTHSFPSICFRSRLHIHPSRPRRRSHALRESLRTMVTYPECGKDLDQCDEHARRTQRRKSRKYRGGQDVAGAAS